MFSLFYVRYNFKLDFFENEIYFFRFDLLFQKKTFLIFINSRIVHKIMLNHFYREN